MLQDKSEEDHEHHNHNQMTHYSQPNIHEDYLRNEMVKANKHQTDDKLNKLIGRFAKMHNSEYLARWKWTGRIQSEG